MKILEKLLCGHKWEVHFTTDIYGKTWNKEKGIIERQQTLICQLCGKIKKIKL